MIVQYLASQAWLLLVNPVPCTHLQVNFSKVCTVRFRRSPCPGLAWRRVHPLLAVMVKLNLKPIVGSAHGRGARKIG